jgi:hypothetical protein
MSEKRRIKSAAQAAKTFADAKAAYDEAVKAKKVAELEFMEACAKEGVDAVIIGDQGSKRKVFIRSTVRSEFNLEKLRSVLKPSVLKKVVAEVVDRKKIVGALEMGLVDQHSLDQATEVTKVTSVMIAELDSE